ncbi:hypothetical protein Ahy_B05g078969 isoform C [Arachis hypogaea]|uniref:Uncharacterized protein n=1 Tax=Arachis hypogaea TaxID=3818 RepID=A0A444Z8P6_ARAHY|nr:hypothetical protein Ahy_B05g078969 isoform C [Arachis hypogaea]
MDRVFSTRSDVRDKQYLKAAWCKFRAFLLQDSKAKGQRWLVRFHDGFSELEVRSLSQGWMDGFMGPRDNVKEFTAVAHLLGFTAHPNGMMQFISTSKLSYTHN